MKKKLSLILLDQLYISLTPRLRENSSINQQKYQKILNKSKKKIIKKFSRKSQFSQSYLSLKNLSLLGLKEGKTIGQLQS